jgi:Protein of unknown function (DUF1350)
MQTEWQDIQGSWVLVPPKPIAIVHFLGGAFIAAAPQVTYRWLLEELAQRGYLIIATPFVNTFDHSTIAEDVLGRFERTRRELARTQIRDAATLPVYGLGHSMGCKLHLLIGSEFEVDRRGNLLMAFNNFAASKSIPLLDKVVPAFNQFAQSNLDLEFIPSPEATLSLVRRQYGIDRNLLIKFRADDLDQTRALSEVLDQKFPQTTAISRLAGNHLTPVGQDVRLQQIGGDFSPIDAVGQWMKQSFFRDLNILRDELLAWIAIN